jgi:hypothetical protein
MPHYDLPINRHIDYFAGWRYLLDPAYRGKTRARWQEANLAERFVDYSLGLLSLLFSTLLLLVLAAALLAQLL